MIVKWTKAYFVILIKQFNTINLPNNKLSLKKEVPNIKNTNSTRGSMIKPDKADPKLSKLAKKGDKNYNSVLLNNTSKISNGNDFVSVDSTLKTDPNL